MFFGIFVNMKKEICCFYGTFCLLSPFVSLLSRRDSFIKVSTAAPQTKSPSVAFSKTEFLSFFYAVLAYRSYFYIAECREGKIIYFQIATINFLSFIFGKSSVKDSPQKHFFCHVKRIHPMIGI